MLLSNHTLPNRRLASAPDGLPHRRHGQVDQRRYRIVGTRLPALAKAGIRVSALLLLAASLSTTTRGQALFFDIRAAVFDSYQVHSMRRIAGSGGRPPCQTNPGRGPV